MKPFDPQLLRLAPATRRPVLALGVVGVLQGVATIGLAFALTDLIVTTVARENLWRPAGWLLALFAGRAILAAVAETTQAWAGVTVAGAVRRRLLAHWLTAPLDDQGDRASAETLAAQGVTAIEPYAAKYLPALIQAAVVPVLAIVTLAFVDWPSALIVVLTLPLLPVFAALIGRTTAEETTRRWSALSDLAGHFLDVVRGLPVLVSYGRGERQVDVIGDVGRRHREATMATLRLAFLSSAARELLATISVAIVAVTAGIRLADGAMPLAPAMLAILLAPEAYWPIRRVGAEFHAAADGADALARIQAVLDGTPQPAAAQDNPDSRLITDVTARHLTYRYPGSDRDVLTDVSLSAGAGITVLTGTSGAGKSTLLEVLAGVREPTSGDLSRARTHLVTQRPFLIAATVRTNLTLGTSRPDDDLWAALRQVDLDGVVAALPRSLDTRLGDDGQGLSAGQRARLVLARALLSDAPVVLLDEPTAHLDERSANTVHDVIRLLAQRRTVIVVTHRPELVRLGDQHVALPGGTGTTVRELS